jgi:hypothetical protein
VAGLRDSKKVRERAGELRQALAAQGVPVSQAEAQEIIVGQIETIARNLGVTERTARDRYLTDPVMQALIRTCLEAGAEHAQARETADNLTLSITDAGHARQVLTQAIALLVNATWPCPSHQHTPGTSCDLTEVLSQDLRRLGGWIPPGRQEPAAGDRST